MEVCVIYVINGKENKGSIDLCFEILKKIVKLVVNLVVVDSGRAQRKRLMKTIPHASF